MRAYVLPNIIGLLACLLATLPAHAASKKYDIEVIIFEDLTNQYLNSEEWPRLEIDLSPDEMPAEMRRSRSGSTAGMKIRENKRRQLVSQAKKIKNSKNYRILVHKAWRQPGLNTKKAYKIPISGSTNSGSSITGTIKVALERYLHVYTDLVYSKPRHSYSGSGISTSSRRSHKDFSIKEHRRMRSREVHYLDHPLVGVLVVAVPVK